MTNLVWPYFGQPLFGRRMPLHPLLIKASLIFQLIDISRHELTLADIYASKQCKDEIHVVDPINEY